MDRRTLLKAGVAAPFAVTALSALSSPATAAPRIGRTIAHGLDYPWGIDFLPDHSALVTMRNSGGIRHVRPDGGSSYVGTVPGVHHDDDGESGLLGLALSPTFASDGWVYVYQSTDSDNRVVRMRYDGRLGSPQPVLTGIPTHRTHNGGGLWFDPAGNLFVTTGDTRNPALAQDLGSLGGKILRIKTDGSPADGNPFGTRVFTYGHRNVECVTASADGRIWASELGENTWDELNYIRKGHNYGWPRSEGSDGPGGYTDPYAQWHTDDCSPSGVAMNHGKAWVGALRGECLWSVDIGGAGAHTKTRHFHGTFGRIRMVKRHPDGSLWIGTSNGGGADKIVRITSS